MIKNILILVLGYFIWIAYFDEAHSANQENQYCDIKTTLIKTVDKNGKTINEESKEIVECNDGVKNILQDAGIAKECKYYNWIGIEGYTPVEYRSLACEKLDGGYELIRCLKGDSMYPYVLTTVASDKTHCKPINLLDPERWVFG